ncbi:MAG TPA: ATP-binding protein [Mycobacteriales bacterium]|nr:ATP-binding protein [Mycobacteriales bacterium]
MVRSDVAVSAHLDISGSPKAAPTARRFVHQELAKVITAELLEDVLLMTTEMVTNVVLHARTDVHLGVTHDGTNVLVTVQDHNSAGPAERARNAEEGQLAESGRGMQIIERLADDFGWSRMPDRHGKVMWFVLAIPQASAS